MSTIGLAWLAVAALSATEPSADPLPSWRLGAAGWASSPIVLKPRPVRGVQLSLDRAHGLLTLGARLSWGLTKGSNESLQATQYHTQLSVLAGAGGRRGVGRWWLLGGLAARLIHERLHRHQDRRLQAAGMDSTIAWSWLLMPATELEAGVAVAFYDRLQLEVAGGPWLTFGTAVGTSVGWQARIGATYEID